MLAIDECDDVVNCTDKLFHIEPLVRELWKTINDKAEANATKPEEKKWLCITQMDSYFS